MNIFWGHSFIFPASALTFKGQVAEESSQEVHGVHDKDGDVRHLLHSLLGRTKIEEDKYNIQHRHAVRIIYGVRVDSLAELGVDGENLGVAHEGESKDGNGVCCLRGAQERGNFCHDHGKSSVKAPLEENTWWLQCVKTSLISSRLAATAYLGVNGEQARSAVGVIVLVDYSIGVLMTVCAWNIQT